MLIKNNLDTEIIAELEYYEANKNNPNIYEELINSFNINSEKEATVLFTIIEVKKLVDQELAIRSISWGCAFALASVVGCTVGLIFASGGTALIYALAMKGLATVALYEACGDGWGDI